MKKLTLEQLKGMSPYTIFWKGEGFIEHPWFNDSPANLEPDGRSVKVKFIVIRGGIHDWAIYHSLDANLEYGDYLGGVEHLDASWEQIARFGGKVHNREIIQRLVPCTDEALKMYRD